MKQALECLYGYVKAYQTAMVRARERSNALIKVRNCNDVLRTLSEEAHWDTKDGAGIL